MLSKQAHQNNINVKVERSEDTNMPANNSNCYNIILRNDHYSIGDKIPVRIHIFIQTVIKKSPRKSNIHRDYLDNSALTIVIQILNYNSGKLSFPFFSYGL
jgi:hypothetical protein